jgi:hypothetical protein
MAATGDNTKRKRASQTGELIGVRLQPDQLGALDAWIARQPDPTPSRPEAIRILLTRSL